MRRVIAHWHIGEFTLLSSPATRQELALVLARPQIQRLVSIPIDDLISGLERFTVHVPGLLILSGICRDSKDDKFIACAAEGKAHYLVSSDHDLLELKYYEDIAIVNPGQFLLALELYSLEPEEMVLRFRHSLLADIKKAIPLEPRTVGRLDVALRLS
jgi:putative PIN family toxin of toxin-antitoxin system